MRRLWIVFLILAATCEVIVAVRRREPVPDTLQALGFDDCGGQPCLNGVGLGMNLADALNRVPDASPADMGMYVPYAVARFGLESYAPHKYYLLQAYDGTINRVIATTYALDMPIGDVVLRYGKPCSLGLDIKVREVVITLHYPRFAAEATVSNGDQFSPGTPVSQFDVEDGSPYCNGRYEYPIGPWQGFRPLERYMAFIGP